MTKGFMSEFKSFIARGNVVDLAVGVVIGGAFKEIVTSLVNDILMPLIGMTVGAVNFTDLKIVLSEATAQQQEVAIKYGSFIQAAIDFLIIAFSIFVFVKLISKLNKKKEEKMEETLEAGTTDKEENQPLKSEELLKEIRDLLREQTEKG